MLGSNSSPRTERAPAYGCANQNPRRAASVRRGPLSRGPRQDCRCDCAFGSCVFGSDRKLVHARRWPTAGSYRYLAYFRKDNHSQCYARDRGDAPRFDFVRSQILHTFPGQDRLVKRSFSMRGLGSRRQMAFLLVGRSLP